MPRRAGLALGLGLGLVQTVEAGLGGFLGLLRALSFLVERFVASMLFFLRGGGGGGGGLGEFRGLGLGFGV